jgi:hypothetical protein
MSTLPLLFPPVLTFSTVASPFLRLSTLFEMMRQTDTIGLDLDLTARPRPPSVATLAGLIEHHDVSVRSVWVPRSAGWAPWPEPVAHRFAAELALAASADLLIVDLPVPPPGHHSRPLVTGLTESLRRMVGGHVAIAVAIRANRLVGGRKHLFELSKLRQLAEEWDFGVALDLRGRIDPRWEAEAAVDRLGLRLQLLRLSTEISGQPVTGPYRILRRAVAASMERDHRVHYALAPTGPAWHKVWRPALMRSTTQASRYLLARQAAVDLFDIQIDSPSPWPR